MVKKTKNPTESILLSIYTLYEVSLKYIFLYFSDRKEFFRSYVNSCDILKLLIFKNETVIITFSETHLVFSRIRNNSRDFGRKSNYFQKGNKSQISLAVTKLNSLEEATVIEERFSVYSICNSEPNYLQRGWETAKSV